MLKRPGPKRGLILAAGLASVSVIVAAIYLIPSLTGPARNEVTKIRRMAASDDPRLAELLDQRMVSVPAGEFLMGSETGKADERPARLVYLDAYWIDQYEITNAQYQRFVDKTGAKAPRHWSGGMYPSGQADMPVVGVSWEAAAAYCAWAGERLPTEAEWEKACRGTDGRVYPWGNRWDASRGNVGQPFSEARSGLWDEAWNYLETVPRSAKGPSLRAVGSYPSGASPFGIMDMVGNAAEWVSDWYNWSDYSSLPDRNPQGTGPDWDHSVRGSAWYLPYGSPTEAQEESRCSARNASHAGDSDARLGFRCARTVP